MNKNRSRLQVPNRELKKQLGKEKKRADEFMVSAIDLNEAAIWERKRVKSLLSLLILISYILTVNTIALIKFMMVAR